MNSFQDKINYIFKNKELLTLALTHKSASKENNERLEFLGDALLNFFITKTIFNKFKDIQEGKLTQIRASLVSRHCLNKLGKELGLADLVVLGRGENTENNSILGNVVEAIVGAIYLDGGLEKTQEFLTKLFEKKINSIEPDKEILDSKSKLQETLQKRGFDLPSYKVIDHGVSKKELRFEAECRIDDLDISAGGRGKNRKGAEQEAASLILHLYLQHD